LPHVWRRVALKEHVMIGSGVAAARRGAAAALFASVAALASAQPASAPHGGGMGTHMDADSTPGGSMMSRAERREHQRKMAGMKSIDECRAYIEQHHATMAERAKARHLKLREPPHDVCAMRMRPASAP
jgi:hypothetical protein